MAIRCFGYYTENTIQHLVNRESQVKATDITNSSEEETKDRFKGVNVVTALGYIPILGIFTAYLRFTVVIENRDKESFSFKATMIVRAVIEAIGCGLLLLIPDIIVSIYRNKTLSVDSFY